MAFNSYLYFFALRFGWSWRFLSLILISTLTDYWVSKSIIASQDDKARRRWLVISIFANLGLLGFFKYCRTYEFEWNAKIHWLLHVSTN